MSRREWLFLAAILLLAAVLRMGWPGLTEFKQDEAHLYTLALDLAEFKTLPLFGISSSVGLPNSPVSVYLFALPLFIWKSPLAPTMFVGLLNTASVGLAYVMARRYWGVRAALAGALLYAAAPWAVIYSRKIWAQNLLPIFVVGYIFSALLAFVEARRRWLMVHFLLLVFIVGLHFSSIALIPLTGLLLGLFRRRVDWRIVFAGAAISVLTLTGVGLYALLRNPNASRLVMDLLTRPAQISPDALTLSALVVMGTHVRDLAGPIAYRTFEAAVPNFNPILWLGGVLVVMGAGYVVWKAVNGGEAWTAHRASTEAGLIITLWLVLPILFFVRHSTPLYPHYFILLFPAPYLLSGIFLDRLLARFPVLWLLPLSIVVSQVWLTLALLQFVGTQNTPQAFGTPLGKLLDVARAAKQLGVEDIVVVGEGSDPNIEFVPAVFDALLNDVPHRFVDGRTTAVFPAGNSVVILWPGDFASVQLYRQWGGGEWAETVPLRAGEGAVFLARGAGVALAVPNPRQASALLSNGAEILGNGGDAYLWELWWLAPGPLEGEDYHLFAHLLNANGKRVAQFDAATYPVRDWHAGDLVVSSFLLSSDGVSVRAGMYAYPSLAPVAVLDANGNPAGEWVEFSDSRP